jgi:hypothetical protein
LDSTSIITNISYGATNISYATYDANAVELLRLTRPPTLVQANGVTLPAVLVAGTEGWRWQPLPQGGILQIQHAQAKNINLTLPPWPGNLKFKTKKPILLEDSRGTETSTSNIHSSRQKLPVAAKDWTITATAGVNGSITPQGLVSATEGATLNFTITPSPGYRIANVLVDGVTQGPLPTYKFDTITQNHAIVASFTTTNSPLPK